MHKQTKSLFLLAVVVLSALVSLIQFPDIAHAQGEAYKWTSGTTIEASGGKFKGKTVFVTTTEKQFQGSSRELATDDVNIDATMGDCDHAVGRIVLMGADESKAKLYIGSLAISGGISNCGTHRVSEQDMDEDITIAAQNTAGSGTNWATKDCSTVTDGHEKTRCVAIKACVVDKKKPAKDCENAWTSCMAPNQSDGAYTGCAQQIADGNTQNATYTPPKGEEEDAGTKETCKIDKLGWIICPIVDFMANLVDAAYSFVASLLVVQPLLVTATNGGQSPIYGAWSTMRNFANVAFVIAFLLIIFSQLTSVGITNYGIKKMLPRLVIAAILVNVSFWVCAIAVDLTNIIGGSVNGLFHAISTNPDGLSGVTPSSFGTNGKGWTGIAGPILAGAIVGVAIYLSISALLPALVMALLAVVTVFLVLTIRQALIILLIVVSPLAFVAYLLPNTESLFKKWLGLFKTMLLMYPIIAGLFGASSLASTVIMQSATGTYAIIIQIMGAMVSIVPLLLTPLVMKSAGSLLNKVGGFVNNPNKGPADWAKKRATETGERIENQRKLRGLQSTGIGRHAPGSAKYRRQAERETVNTTIASRAQRQQSAYLAQATQSDQVSVSQQLLAKASGGRVGGNSKGDQLLSAMSEGGGDDARNMALANAISTQRGLESKEEEAALTTLRSLNPDATQLQQLSQGKSVDVNGTTLNAGASHAVRAAAMQEVIDTHDVAGVNALLDSASRGEMDAKTREAFADRLDHSKEKPAYVSKGAIAEIRQHGNDAKNPDGTVQRDAAGNTIKVQAQSSTQMAVNAINNNTYSVDKIANGDRHELAHIATLAAQTNIGVDGRARTKLKENAVEAGKNPRYAGQISKNVNEVTHLSNL